MQRARRAVARMHVPTLLQRDGKEQLEIHACSRPVQYVLVQLSETQSDMTSDIIKDSLHQSRLEQRVSRRILLGSRYNAHTQAISVYIPRRHAIILAQARHARIQKGRLSSCDRSTGPGCPGSGCKLQ